MALDQGIIRFGPDGPPGQGLEPLVEITPEMLEEGSASERGHNYYRSPSGLLTAGVWKCTAHTLKFGPYPVDEFMLVLEGSVNIVHEDGLEEIFRAGDAFVIPKGLPCQWKQTESIHKIYVILDDPDTPIPEEPASSHAIRLSASEGLAEVELSNPENFEGGTPTQEDCSAFEDTTDRFFVGTWTCSPMRRKAQRFGRVELMCLLEGGMTLTDDTGLEHSFTAPEVLLELPDTVSAWTSTEKVRKYYCIFEE
jgi:uncharacterized cupin superfamily protein